MGKKLTTLAVFALAASCAFAQEAAPADGAAAEAEEPQETAEQKADREAMEGEIAYVEALVSYGYPDFAETVIAETKKKWPQSEAAFFAIEVRGLLSMNKFDEAEKLIAALPDRKSQKYWAARLEVANNYFARNKKEDCMKIYDEFFAAFPKAPKGLEKFYVNAGYAYGQLLSQAQNYKRATSVYGGLLKSLNGKDWLSLATEYCDVSLRYAESLDPAKDKDERAKALEGLCYKMACPAAWAAAKRNNSQPKNRPFIDEVIDTAAGAYDDEEHPETACYNAVLMGRGIGMKAHLSQLQGNVRKANLIIDDYREALEEIDDQIRELDPEGFLGLQKVSPLPEVMYLQAKMLWDEAQKTYADPKHDDEQVKAYLFGEKDDEGKRDGIGAFNISISVYTKFEMSPWAPLAGEMAEDVRKFAEEKYQAKIKTKITAEDIARVRAAQFKAAKNKFLNDEYEAAIADYMEVLGRYPELEESIYAIQNVIDAYLKLQNEDIAADLKAEYRDNADAMEGYLAERFAGNKDNVIMTTAGNAVLACAGKETERGDKERADQIITWFVKNYRKHVKAANIAAGKGSEAMKEGNYDEAIRYFGYVDTLYTNSTVYAISQLQLGQCYDKKGDRENAKKYYKNYTKLETSPAKLGVAQMQLAQMYQKDGQDLLTGGIAAADGAAALPAEGEAKAEGEEGGEVAAAESGTEVPAPGQDAEAQVSEENIKKGLGEIIRAIKQFGDLAKVAEEGQNDQKLSEAEKKTLMDLREASLFLAAQCRGRLAQNLKKIGKPEEMYQKFMIAAAEAYNTYIKAFPQGKYAKNAYMQESTIYTGMNDLAKAKECLDGLSRSFPDSEEAKNSKPTLAKSLIDMGMTREGTELYAEMLRTEGASYRPQQFVAAGEALINAKSWDYANQAFEKAIRLAGTNFPATVAKARIGQARSAFKQGSLAEARDALDVFLQDDKMSKMAIAADANFLLVEVAKAQGRTEQDATQRGKYFGAAVGALKKVRTYWAKKPQWQQDQLDLLSGEVLIDRMNAEEAMGLKEDAMETCGRAAATFQVFIQAHGPTQEVSFEQLDDGSKQNLERAYANIIPLFAKQGAEQADQVVKFGNQYLEYFPNGKHKTAILNAVNSAKADLPAEAETEAQAPEQGATTEE